MRAARLVNSFRHVLRYLTRRLPDRAVCAFVLLGTAVLYWPGLGGGFLLDDYPNIVFNEAIRFDAWAWDGLLEALLAGTAGPTGRPVSMLTFALNYRLAGLDPFWLKLTNLIIHLANGALVFQLSERLLRLARFGAGSEAGHVLSGDLRLAVLTVAAAWTLHPIQLTTVLYTVQRMTGLAAFFCLAGLCLYVQGRRLQAAGGSGGGKAIAAAFLVCWPLAALSKENGALLPLWLLAVEAAFFRFQGGPRRALLALHAATALVPVALGAYLTAIAFEPLFAGYQGRDFTLSERLYTQCRVLWRYLFSILLPDNRRLSLYHDDVSVSTGPLDPPSTLPALLGVCALPAAALMLYRPAPVASFGIAFFLIGHLVESTVLPLEIMYEHRNYLPSYGILLALFYALSRAAFRAGPVRPRVVWPLLASLMLLIVFNTGIRTRAWGQGGIGISLHELAHKPDSPRAHYGAGVQYYRLASQASSEEERDGFYRQALHHLQAAAWLLPDIAVPWLEMIHVSGRLGMPALPHWWHAAGSRMSHRNSFPISHHYALRSLLQCQFSQRCFYPEDSVERLLAIVEEASVTWGGPWAARIYQMLADYRWNTGEIRAAADLLYRAREAAPAAISPRKFLVAFMFHTKNCQLAWQEWQALERAYPLRSRVRSMRRQVREWERMCPRPPED